MYIAYQLLNNNNKKSNLLTTLPLFMHMYRLIDLSFFIANRPKSVYLSQNDRGARWPTTKTKTLQKQTNQNKSIKLKKYKQKINNYKLPNARKSNLICVCPAAYGEYI